MFYKTKGWWKSKIIWTQIVGVLLAVAALFGYIPVTDPATVVTAITSIIAAVTILFRSQSDTVLVASTSTQ